MKKKRGKMMEIKDFVVKQIEKFNMKINSLENDLQSIYLRKSELSADMDKLRESIVDKQNEALFRPQELGETFQLDEMMREYSSFDSNIEDIKKQLSGYRENLGMFRKIFNYIRNIERQDEIKSKDEKDINSKTEYQNREKDSVSKVKEENKRKNMELYMQLHGLKGNLNFAKKICLSDTRRCMMEIDKIIRQIDKILDGIN